MESTPIPKIFEVFPGCIDQMIYVEGGTFEMGSTDEEAYSDEGPVHKVKLISFFIGKYPVTQALWIAIMDDNPSFFSGPLRPVEQVSWEDCQIFLQKLKEKTGRNYRLLTEAEWEYAAKGGPFNSPYKYAGSDKLEEVGWFFGNSHRETKTVGQKYPNALGIYDMSGNVYEWCQDWFDSKYYQACFDKGLVENPQGPESGSSRVVRGGRWGSHARYCRVACRFDHAPEYRTYDVGIRLALSP